MLQKKMVSSTQVAAAAPLTFDMEYLENELERLQILHNYYVGKFAEVSRPDCSGANGGGGHMEE